MHSSCQGHRLDRLRAEVGVLESQDPANLHAVVLPCSYLKAGHGPHVRTPRAVAPRCKEASPALLGHPVRPTPIVPRPHRISRSTIAANNPVRAGPVATSADDAWMPRFETIHLLLPVLATSLGRKRSRPFASSRYSHAKRGLTPSPTPAFDTIGVVASPRGAPSYEPVNTATQGSNTPAVVSESGSKR